MEMQRKNEVLLGLLMLVSSSLSFADGPCPDGQFNPQNTVCMCPGGGFVAPNAYCNRGGGITHTWGAIALELEGYQKSGFASSADRQSAANEKALKLCRYNTCRVALTFKDSCGAIAIQYGGGPWGGGLEVTKLKLSAML